MYIDEALKKIQEDNPHIVTQQALAELTNISAPLLSIYKKGEGTPSIVSASKIWKRFGIQVEPFTTLALEEYCATTK